MSDVPQVDLLAETDPKVNPFGEHLATIAKELPENFAFEINASDYRGLEPELGFRRAKTMRAFENRLSGLGYRIRHDYLQATDRWVYTVTRDQKLVEALARNAPQKRAIEQPRPITNEPPTIDV